MASQRDNFETFETAYENPSLGKPSCYDVLASSTGGISKDLKKWEKIQLLNTSCSVYNYIIDYVRNSNDGRNIQVNRIYKIERHGELGKINEKYRILVWHETTPSAIPGIILTDFRMGSRGNFGEGIYFADRIAKSISYTSRSSNGTRFLIITEIFPGKVYKAHHIHSDYKTAPSGFDSVKGNGKSIPNWKDNQDYYGAIIRFRVDQLVRTLDMSHTTWLTTSISFMTEIELLYGLLWSVPIDPF